MSMAVTGFPQKPSCVFLLTHRAAAFIFSFKCTADIKPEQICQVREFQLAPPLILWPTSLPAIIPAEGPRPAAVLWECKWEFSEVRWCKHWLWNANLGTELWFIILERKKYGSFLQSWHLKHSKRRENLLVIYIFVTAPIKSINRWKGAPSLVEIVQFHEF